MRGQGAVSAEELARLDRDGFLVVSRPVAGRRSIERARAALVTAFASPGAVPPGALRDLAGSRPGAAAAIPELLNPSWFVPGLASSAIVTGSARLARRVLGSPVRLLFDHAISKPPHNGEATAWHQDGAYATVRPGSANRTVTIWVALQDVGERDGCMRFVPGSHMWGFVTHEVAGTDEYGPLLRSTLAHDAHAVSCPVSAGGVTLHRQTTLHSTGPNEGDRARLAWILRFEKAKPPMVSRRVRSAVAGALRR